MQKELSWCWRFVNKKKYFWILRFYNLSLDNSITEQNRTFYSFFTILGKSLAFFAESWVNVRIYFQHNLVCKATKIWRNLPVDLTGKIRQIVLAFLENLIFSWQRIVSRKLGDFFQFVWPSWNKWTLVTTYLVRCFPISYKNKWMYSNTRYLLKYVWIL